MKSGEPTTQPSTLGLGANLINGYLNGKVNVFNNKAAIVFSLRHSLSGFWQTPTFNRITKRIHQGVLLELPQSNKLPEGIIINDDFDFFDSNFKFTQQLSAQDKLSAALFYGENDFQAKITDEVGRREQSDSLFLQSRGISVAWQHEWQPGISSKILALSTAYEYEYKYQVNNLGQSGFNKNGIKSSAITERQLH